MSELRILQDKLSAKDAEIIQLRKELSKLSALITHHENAASSAVRAYEKKYTTIIENMSLGLIEVDNEGVIGKVNSAFCAMTGYQMDELLHVQHDILLPDHWKKTISDQTALRTKKISSAYEIQIRKKNGDLLWVLISGSPIYNKNDEVIGSIGIHYDMSSQKMLQSELEKAKKEAEEAQEAEKLFLANMSHEIRTPLNALLGMAHLLEDTPLNKEQKECLDLLQISGKYLQKLVSDVLDFSRIESGNLEVQAQSFDLNKVVEELFRAFDSVLDKNRVLFYRAIRLDASRSFIGDESLIRQILVNLLSNATKFTRAGTIGLEVSEIARENQQLWIRIAVSDTGIGIPSEQVELIFQSYKQANFNIREEFGGSGLGLAITQRLVRLLNGRISVESHLNQGSVFTVDIPLLIAADPPVLTGQMHPVNLPSLQRVLIAEDNLINRKYLEGLMKKGQIAFDSTEDGVAALELARQNVYQIIFIDIHLVGMDGMEVVRRIREQGSLNETTPILALTASATSSVREAALLSGVNEVLFKPYNPRQLCDKVTTLRSKIQLNTSYESSESTTQKPLTTEILWSPEGLADLYAGDQAYALEMFVCFQEKHLPELDILEKAILQENWFTAQAIAHKLKPGFEMVGFRTIAALLLKIESAELSEPSSKSIKLYFDQLYTQLPAIRQLIQHKIRELESKQPPTWIIDTPNLF